METFDYLSDLEKEAVVAFCANEVMSEAVRKVLLQHIYSQGTLKAGEAANPLQNRAFALAQYSTENPVTNDALGMHIRGVWEGVNALEHGYMSLEKVKVVPVDSVESPYNEAE